MTATTDRGRAHGARPGRQGRIKTALAPSAPENQTLRVRQLAMFDQFHTPGILVTAALNAGDQKLDVGCGIGGRFALHDAVRAEGEVIYPAPRACNPSTSLRVSAEARREALGATGASTTLWRNKTPTAIDWCNAGAATSPSAGGLCRGGVTGAAVAQVMCDLGRNIRAGRLGVLAAALTRD